MITEKKPLKNLGQRLMSLLLCLCMCLSFVPAVFSTEALADGESASGGVQITVFRWLNGKLMGEETYEASGIFSIRKANADLGLTANDYKSYIVSYGNRDADVSVVTDDTGASVVLDLSRAESVVRIHLYYGENGGTVGDHRGSGTLNTETSGTGADKLYNTREGLHTDKTAAVATPGPGFDNNEAGDRTFDLTLEAWYAETAAVSVGLILDASGSMVFISDEDKLDIVARPDDLPVSTVGANRKLSSDQINSVMDSNKTDNTMLGYQGYSYYVFDPRSNTAEYVPLAYWDGRSPAGNSDAQLDDGVIRLNTTKGNPAAGWYYINTAGSVEGWAYQSTKTFRGLATPMAKVNESAAPTITDVFTNTDGPCVFYFDTQGQLHCIFSPNSSGGTYYYADSLVYRKQDNATIKAEDLGNALTSFTEQLKTAITTKELSAVRFSSPDFGNRNTTNNRNERSLRQLLLQGWTTTIPTGADLMSQNRNSLIFDADVQGRHNFVFTGSTYSWTGMQEFINDLMGKETLKNSDNWHKYVILFTDGKDQGISTAESTVKTIKAAGYTIFSIMLTGGANVIDDELAAFLSNVSSEPNAPLNANQVSTSEYVYHAKNGTELGGVFYDILAQIAPHLHGYTVQDTIDPRFDLVALVGAFDEASGEPVADGNFEDAQVLHLNANGVVKYGENTATVTGTSGLPVKLSDDEENIAVLYYADGMYYLQWQNQSIPGCDVGAQNLNVWSNTIRVTAKEDFMGGNAVLSNGNGANQNYVFHPDDADANSASSDTTKTSGDEYPSRGFPRTTVNVRMKDMELEGIEEHIYMGETIDPKQALIDLLKELKIDTAGDGSEYLEESFYWDYLQRYARAHASTENDAEAVLDGILDAILAAKDSRNPFKLGYSYLPNADGTNQTGTDAHRADVVGQLTFTWKQTSPTQVVDPETEFTTEDTYDRVYDLSVTYRAYPDPNSSFSRDKADLTERNVYNGKLIDSSDGYTSPKAAVGLEQGELTEHDTHTTDIVRGELALELKADVDDLYWMFTNGPWKGTTSQTFTVTYTGDNGKTGKLTVTVAKDAVETAWNGGAGKGDTFKAFSYTYQNDEGTSSGLLPQGDYTFTLGDDTHGLDLTLEYAPEEDYENHFTRTAANERSEDATDVEARTGVITEEAEETDYIAPQGTESAEEGVVFELGSRKAKAEDRTDDEPDNDYDYLNDRLGMAMIEAELDGVLVISKEMDSDSLTGKENEDFEFSVTLTDRNIDEQPLGGEFPYTKTLANGSTETGMITFDDGTGTIESIQPYNENGEPEGEARDNLTLKPGESIVIDLPAGTKYVVEETLTAEQTAGHISFVKATARNEETEISGETVTGMLYTDANDPYRDEVEYTNLYMLPVNIDMGIAKSLTGRSFRDGDAFSFTVTRGAGSTTPQPMPGPYITDADGHIVSNGQAADTFTFTFTPDPNGVNPQTLENIFASNGAALIFEKPGTYYYIITENDCDLPGVSKDPTEYRITVTVSVNEPARDGLVAEISAVEKRAPNETGWTTVADKTALFENDFDAESTFVNMQASKSLVNDSDPAVDRGVDAGDYEFVLEALGGRVYSATAAPADAASYNLTYPGPLPTEGGSLDGTNHTFTAANNGEGRVSFNGIEFTSAYVTRGADGSETGTDSAVGWEYLYQITEKIPAEADKLGGVDYTETKYYVVVRATIVEVMADNGQNVPTVKAEIKYYDEDGYLLQNGSSEAQFINVYAASGETQLPVSKEVTGDWDADTAEFKFIIEGARSIQSTGKDKPAPMPAEGTITIDFAAETEGLFGKIEFTEEDDGNIYYYTIREEQGSIPGFTYDDSQYRVYIQVTDNDDGTVTPKIIEVQKKEHSNWVMLEDPTPESGWTSDDLREKIVINNLYSTDEQGINLQGTKKLTGTGVLNAGDFTFITEAADKEGTPLNEVPEGVRVLTGNGYRYASRNTADLLGNEESGEREFTGEFTILSREYFVYTKVGTYYYLVSETDGGLNGYVYDQTQYLITVEVTDEESVLNANVTKVQSRANSTSDWTDIEPEGDWTETGVKVALEFSNESTAGAVLVPQRMYKELLGDTLTAGRFKFMLTVTKENGDGVTDADVVPSAPQTSLVNDAFGVVFQELEFKMPGTYTITVTEVQPTEDGTFEGTPLPGAEEVTVNGEERWLYEGVVYARNTYTATVRVYQDEQNNLIAARDDSGGTSTDFENDAGLTIHKELSTAGSALTSQEEAMTFNFTAVFDCGSSENVQGYWVKSDGTTGTFQTIGNGSPAEIGFTLKGNETITFYGLPVGTTYTVTENEVDARFTVVDESGRAIQTNSITGTMAYNTEAEFTFNNQKRKLTPAVVNLEAIKTIDNQDSSHQFPLERGDFAFTITPAEKNAELGGDPIPAAGLTVYNNADGVVQLLTNVNYSVPQGRDASQVVYEYTVREVQGNLPGISYSDAVYTVKVTVTENFTSGEYEATVQVWDKDDDLIQTIGNDGTITGSGAGFVNPFNSDLVTYVIGGDKNLTGDTVLLDDDFTFLIEPVSATIEIPVQSDSGDEDDDNNDNDGEEEKEEEEEEEDEEDEENVSDAPSAPEGSGIEEPQEPEESEEENESDENGESGEEEDLKEDEQSGETPEPGETEGSDGPEDPEDSGEQDDSDDPDDTEEAEDETEEAAVTSTVSMPTILRRIWTGVSRLFAPEDEPAPVDNDVEDEPAPVDDDDADEDDTVEETESVELAPEDMPMPESDTAKNKADGSFTFDAIEFVYPGIYTYKITEINEHVDGYLYDDTVYSVTITVVRNEDGALVVESSVVEGGNGVLEFNNVYDLIHPEIVLHKYQSLNGGERTQARLTAKDGDEVTYYISVTNVGTAAATNVVVTDKVPAGLELIEESISEGGVLGDDGVTITWTFARMVGLESREVSFAVRVPDVANYTLWKNVASANYDGDDPDNPPPPSTSEEVEVEEGAPIITIRKSQAVLENSALAEPTENKITVQADDVITYYLTVRNSGTETAEGVKVMDTVPQEPVPLTLVKGSISDGGRLGEDGITIYWELGDIPVGGSRVVTFQVTVPYREERTIWENIGYVAYDNDPTVPDDPDHPRNPWRPSNPVESEEGTPRVVIHKAQALTGETPSTEKRTAKIGDVVTYTLTVTNLGDAHARNVVVTDAIPQEPIPLTLVSGSISDGGRLGRDGVTITWELGTLKAGETRTLTFQVTVPKVEKTAVWKNIAYVTYDNPPTPPNPSEEVEVEATPVTPSGSATAPNTGDANRAGLWLAVLAAGTLGLTVLTATRRRKSNS